MKRRSVYHGQTVQEADVDEWFDDVEDMETGAVADAGMAQAAVTDSPDPSVFGGILNGLEVTGTPGAEFVTVTLGNARDEDGERIPLPSDATVKISKTGQTVIADTALAEGDGAAITGTCAAGKYIVVSLFISRAILQEQLTADPAGGASFYYDQLESFRFQLEIGSSDFTHATPLTDTVTRAALSNELVLLADIICENAAGTMQVVAIMNSTPDWIGTYSPPGNYANVTGRRADWLTVQTTDEFTTAEGAEDIIREQTAREALYDLGRRVRSEAFTAHRPEAAPALFSMRKQYGHPARSHEFFDDMMYRSYVYDSVAGEFGPHWACFGIGGALGVSPTGNRVDVPLTIPGGIASLTTTNVATQGVRIASNIAWNLGAAPWAIALFRFRVEHSTALQSQQVGFTEALGVNQNQVGLSIGSVINAYAYDSAGGIVSSNLLNPVVAGTFYTARIAVFANNKALFQLNNDPVVTLTLAGTFSSSTYMLYGQSYSADGTPRYLMIDQAYAADAQLEADMA
jgi:hypothetical protein